jgi:hypothetical protein
MRRAKPMDEELRKEIKKTSKGVNRLNTRLDRLDKRINRNMLDTNQTTMLTVALSIVLSGVILQLQQNDWSISGFFIFLGVFVAIVARFGSTPHFKKYLRIAFWVALSVAVGLTAYLVFVLISK